MQRVPSWSPTPLIICYLVNSNGQKRTGVGKSSVWLKTGRAVPLSWNALNMDGTVKHAAPLVETSDITSAWTLHWNLQETNLPLHRTLVTYNCCLRSLCYCHSLPRKLARTLEDSPSHSTHLVALSMPLSLFVLLLILLRLYQRCPSCESAKRFCYSQYWGLWLVFM